MIGAALADCWRRAGAPARCDLCRARARAAERWRAMRCGCCARRALAARRISSRPARSCARRSRTWCPERAGTIRSPTLPRAAAAAGRQRIPRCPADPPICRWRRALRRGDRRRTGVRSRSATSSRTSPARDEAVATIAARLVANGGVALIIDYGHARSAPGDTLQAVRGHRFAPVLADPGEQDLTSHVDFEARGRSATEAGAAVTQLARAGRLAEAARHRRPRRKR